MSGVELHGFPVLLVFQLKSSNQFVCGALLGIKLDLRLHDLLHFKSELGQESVTLNQSFFFNVFVHVLEETEWGPRSGPKPQIHVHAYRVERDVLEHVRKPCVTTQRE